MVETIPVDPADPRIRETIPVDQWTLDTADPRIRETIPVAPGRRFPGIRLTLGPGRRFPWTRRCSMGAINGALRSAPASLVAGCGSTEEPGSTPKGTEELQERELGSIC